MNYMNGWMVQRMSYKRDNDQGEEEDDDDVKKEHLLEAFTFEMSYPLSHNDPETILLNNNGIKEN